MLNSKLCLTVFSSHTRGDVQPDPGVFPRVSTCIDLEISVICLKGFNILIYLELSIIYLMIHSLVFSSMFCNWMFCFLWH